MTASPVEGEKQNEPIMEELHDGEKGKELLTEE